MSTRRMARWAIAAACVVCTACGDDSETPNTPTTPGDSGTVTIRGTERLGWDQSASSAQVVNGYTFIAYVDGTPNTVADVRCAASTAGLFSCTARLPALSAGRHELRLSASAGGAESGRSSPLNVNVVPSALAQGLFGSATIAADASAAAGVCTTIGASDCFDIDVLAAQLGAISAIAATPEATFFVEDGVRVRIGRGARVDDTPAFEAVAGTRIIGLAAAPDFAQSRAVYLAIREHDRRGDLRATVMRFREVGGVLGQGAAIVPGLTVGPDDRMPLAIGADGSIYAGVPGRSGAVAAPAVSLDGALVHVSASGSAAAVNASASPVVADGYAFPTALALDRTGRLWFAGVNPHRSDIVSSLAVDRPADIRAEILWPGAIPPAADVSLVLDDDAGAASPALVSVSGVAYRAVGSGDARRLEALPLDGQVTAMTVGAAGEILVAVAQPDATSHLLRLQPR